MSSTPLLALVARCRALCRPRSNAPDHELLSRFVQKRDAAAFEELLERYAPLVWGVCRRIAASETDGEDAFQATFLALVRQAGRLDARQPLGGWLHTVAARIARRTTAQARKQVPQATIPEPATSGDIADEAGSRELCRIVDEEIERLPIAVREPLILCCLQGRTRDEAAVALGCSVAAVKSRLERGRDLLKKRLQQRGVQLPAAFLILGLTSERIRAALWAKTMQAVCGAAPPAVVALVPAMGAALASKLTLSAMFVVLASALSFGAYWFMCIDPIAEPPASTKNPPLASGRPSPDETSQPRLDRLGDPLPPGAVARLGTIRLRPGGRIALLAFSPDGKKLAAWSSELYCNDGLTLWDVRTGRLLRRVDMPGVGVPALNWNGNGIALLVTGDAGKTPLVWDFSDGKPAPKVQPRPGLVGFGFEAAVPAIGKEADSCYAVSPDGKVLAIGKLGKEDKPQPIRLRPLKCGVRIGDLPAPKELARQPGNCAMLLFTPDGKKLIAFNAPKKLADDRQEDKQLVVVWDAASGKEIVRFTAPQPGGSVRAAVAVSNRMLAIGLQDGATSLWDLANGKERRLKTDHIGKKLGQGWGTLTTAFTPDGKILVTAGSDYLVKLWDAASGRHLRTLERHCSWIEALAISPDGRTIAAGGDRLIRLWDTASGADACPLAGHRMFVQQAVLSPDGKTAVTGGMDGTLRWWDAASGRPLRVVELSGPIEGLTISPDGKTVLATIEEERLHTWDLATGQETTPKELPRDKVGALAFTPDGKQFLSASGPHITVWTWPALKRVRTIELPKPAKSPGENNCLSLAISPDGRWLVTVAERFWFREERGMRFGSAADGVVDLWNLADGKRVRRLVEDQSVINSAAFTADGRLVLGGSGVIPAEGRRPAQKFEGVMNLLDPLAPRWVRSFASPPMLMTPGLRFNNPYRLLLSPDGRTLYASYNTGPIVAFEVATGQARRTLSGHRRYIPAIGCSPDGRRLISGAMDETALVWDITLAAAATPHKQPLDAAALEKLWKTADGTEATAAFIALADLAAAGDQAVSLLRRQIKPIAKGPTSAELDRIFEKLDSDDFAARDKASRDLAAFGEAAVPGVRQRLSKGVSLELRLRALAFLDKFDHKELSHERIRQVRAIELLEAIGTPAAKGLLADLAKGAPGVPLTLESMAALKRLQRFRQP